MAALTGGKGFPFLFQHIRDGINIRQTCNLIFSLCRYNNRLAEHVGSSLAHGRRLTAAASNVCFLSADRVDALHLHRKTHSRSKQHTQNSSLAQTDLLPSPRALFRIQTAKADDVTLFDL